MPYEMRRTPTVAKTNASGTARPTRPTVPCGLMLAAIDGAISATEMPIASQIERLPVRRRPGALAGAAMTPPFLFRSGRAGGECYAESRRSGSLPVCRIYKPRHKLCGPIERKCAMRAAACSKGAIGAAAVGSGAVGALAVGSLAIGALAVGALAIGRLAIRRAAIQKLVIGELEVGRLRVRELVVDERAGAAELSPRARRRGAADRARPRRGSSRCRSSPTARRRA